MRWIDEFKAFIQRGNVIDLAVAVIIGAAFGNIVKSVVDDIFSPFLGFAQQGSGFSVLDFPIYGGAQVKFGAFLQAVLNFLIISICVFLIVKGVNALHVGKVLAPPPPPETPTEKLLTEIRDLLKANRPINP